MIAVGSHTLPDGRVVEVVEITGGGVRARLATLGAALLNLWVPDFNGELEDLALGHAELAGYLEDEAYLGVAVGPVAGRIGGAKIRIDGEAHPLDANEGSNTLHSGPTGLHQLVWSIEEINETRVEMEAVHGDGTGGFPGTLIVRLTYTLEGGSLQLNWAATTTAPTPVALTHHAYFHLDGHDAGSVRSLLVQSDADLFLPIRPDSVPTGELAPTPGTPFDLRQPVRLGDILAFEHPQIELANGLDHDLLVLPHGPRQLECRRVAQVWGARRGLEVWTTEPAVHLYAGGYLDVANGKDGARYGPNSGLAIETQPPPDATAHAAFPVILLRPGKTFRSRTVYQFHRALLGEDPWTGGAVAPTG